MIGSLVSTAGLADLSGVRIVDASWFLPEHGRDARAEYRAGHIPGAAFLDLSTAKPGTVAIDPNAAYVVYDDSPLKTAARGWWLLKSSGARSVAILDGGLAKWRSEGRALEAGAGITLGTTTVARVVDSLRDKDDVRTTTDQIVDARSPARFAGEEPEPRAGVVPGHIPGARNVHYATLYDADGTWNHGDALAAAFTDAGVDLDLPVTTTCGSGVTACSLIFGLHLLGRDAALYGGSWADWGSDPTTPKETGR